MKMNFAKSAANQNNLIAADLERQLKAMAVADKAQPKTAAADTGRDGMLGTLFFDCLFGAPLSDLFADTVEQTDLHGNPALSVGTAVDMYDEFRRDRAKNNDRTNASIELGVSGAVNGLFNRAGQGAVAAELTRRNLEDQYAVIARMKRPPGLYMAA